MDHRLFEEIDNKLYKAKSIVVIASSSLNNDYSGEELSGTLWAVEELIKETSDLVSELYKNNKIVEKEEKPYVLDVTEVETHEDGSATYKVDMDDRTQEILFSSMFVSGILRGMDELKTDNQYYLNNLEVRRRAQDLVNMLNMWEVTDELDYEPTVKESKARLEECLRQFVRPPRTAD
jgi:hypothetical protein